MIIFSLLGNQHIPVETRMETAVIAAVVLAVVIAVYLFRARTRRARRAALQLMAPQLGFEFVDAATARLPELPRHLELYTLGNGVAFTNIMVSRGPDPDFTIADVEVGANGPPRSTHFHQTIATLHIPGANLPKGVVIKASVSKTIGWIRRSGDVNYQPDPQFSNEYVLLGKLDALLNPTMVQFLRQQKLSAELGGEFITVYRANELVPAGEYGGFLATAREFATRLGMNPRARRLPNVATKGKAFQP